MDVPEMVITADDVNETVTVHFKAYMYDIADAAKFDQFIAYLTKRLQVICGRPQP